ncbi:MAG TPA: hypothetical protein VF469_29615, partial [Kofleriaceae bacterium]
VGPAPDDQHRAEDDGDGTSRDREASAPHGNHGSAWRRREIGIFGMAAIFDGRGDEVSYENL